MDIHDSSFSHRAIVFKPKNVVVDNSVPLRSDVGYRCELEFVNALPVTVRIANRQGVVFAIKPDPKLRGCELRIRQIQQWDWRTDFDARGITDSRAVEAKAMVDSLLANLTGQYNANHRQASIATILRMEDLRNNGGTIYVENLDLVISIEGEGLLIHPHSEQGVKSQMIRDTQGAGLRGSANFTISIIDNHRKIGNQFINLGGDIYLVPATEDPSRGDGIYVIRTGLSQGDYAPEPTTLDVYDFEEGKQLLKLYDTVNQARTNGDQEAAFKRQYDLALQDSKNEELKLKADLRARETALKEAEHSLKELSALVDTEKQKNELTKIQMEGELRVAKNEVDLLKHKLELVSNQRKDYYEDRSHSRKDSSEMLKWLPLVIVGVGAAIMGLKK